METTSISLPPLHPPPEVHIDLTSKRIATTDKASQDGYGIIEEVDKEWIEEGSEEGTSTDSEDGPKVVVNEMYRQLFKAALKGDWKTAERILKEDPQAMISNVLTIQAQSVTVLEVAVVAAQEQLVKNLLKHLPQGYDCWAWSFTMALRNAALRGGMKMVKELMDTVNPDSDYVDFALWIVIEHAPTQKEVIWYLARRTSSDLDNRTLRFLIMAGHLDIVLYLLHKYLKSRPLPSTKIHGMMGSLLGNLVTMKSHFRSGAKLKFWENVIYNCIPLCLADTSFDNFKDTKMARSISALERFKTSLQNLSTKLALLIKRIGELKLRHKYSLEFANRALAEMKTSTETPEILKLTSGIALEAASRGISEIVKLCLEHFPELTWDQNFTKKLIKEVVIGRHVALYRLVNAHNTFPYLTDNSSTKHGLMEAVVGWSLGCAPTDVSGAAFVMQRELQWFKVLEDRSDPTFKIQEFQVQEDTSDPSLKNVKLVRTKERRGKTYWEVFVEQRQDLLKEAGQWMKDTSSSCSVVATLILTMAFAAAFTTPGGNNGDTGVPIFLKKGSFLVFMIADALALFSSVTATLIFLVILTSRYKIEDFLLSLPRKMILGLTFLFLSLAFMLVAFGSALTIVLIEWLKWIYIPITLLVAFPVVLFTILQLPLYVEMVESTCWPRLYRPVKILEKSLL